MQRLRRAIRRWLQATQGDLDDMLMGIEMTLLILALFFFLTTIAWVFEARNTLVNGLVTAANQAVVDATLDPSLAGSLSQSQNAYLSQSTATQAFNNLIGSSLAGWNPSLYTIGTPIVYEPSQAGSDLPDQLGTVPGAGMYVAAEFQIPLIPWASTKALTYTLAVQVFIPANRYDNYAEQVHGTWIGG
jgi:hypothetical protein